MLSVWPPVYQIQVPADEVDCSWVHAMMAPLMEGMVLTVLKEMMVHAVLKKPSLDPTFFDSINVSNFPFLEKLVEKMVRVRMKGRNGLFEPISVRFKPQDPPHIPLWAVHYSAPILVLLALSVAFNTIDYDIFLSWLHRLGIGATVLKWFPTFLWGLFQSEFVERDCSFRPSSILFPNLISIRIDLEDF